MQLHNNKEININRMNTISVVIPIHTINNELKKFFTNAVTSVAQQIVQAEELLIVASKDEALNAFLNSYEFGSLKSITKVVVNPGETDFASQLNYAATQVSTTHMCILEVDDELSKIWLKNVKTYMEAYPLQKAFLPIIVDTNANGEFIDLSNQPVWAAEFSQEMGIVDFDTLLAYQNFNTDGLVIDVETYKEVGGLKPSLKLTFIYEFLLRMTHFDNRLMVIPRLGYKHMNQRPGSLFFTYKDQITPAEARFWMNTAKKEYHHKHDRKITYAPETT